MVGYNFLSMVQYAKDYMKKCEWCQKHGNAHNVPPYELNMLTSPGPFSWYGMHILGSFSLALGLLKFLIATVNYFTKWIEVEASDKITTTNINNFFKRIFLARYGIPQLVINDNGTQFTNKNLRKIFEDLNIKNHFTSVRHL